MSRVEYIAYIRPRGSSTDARVLDGMTKRWLQYVRDQVEESMQARFNFNNDLVGSVNQISCNLSISSHQIIDGFSSCQVKENH